MNGEGRRGGGEGRVAEGDRSDEEERRLPGVRPGSGGSRRRPVVASTIWSEFKTVCVLNNQYCCSL